MKNILVYGFYFKNNIGDQLFIEAFKSLFPSLNFKFVDFIRESDLINISGVFIGGGSFLDQDPGFSNGTIFALKKTKVFYIGVGAETNIHPAHADLIKSAKYIYTRTPEFIDKIKLLNNKVDGISDIVYCLAKYKKRSNNKSVLVLPNISVVPNWSSPNWQHAAWNYFKSEFCQFLDCIIEQGYNINFFDMCKNHELNDSRASAEIISFVKNKNKCLQIDFESDHSDDIIDLFAEYNAVITERFHGIVISEIVRVPYLAIFHHNKIKDSAAKNGEYLSYYGISKDSLIKSFNLAINSEFNHQIDISKFRDLSSTILSIIG
jgi:polysaccharide pyruvyl transferase WcaK-like protein